MYQILQNPDMLVRLKNSKFRRNFHLPEYEKKKLRENGLLWAKEQAYELITKKLHGPNDGRQTPKIGHPVFIAMHATACCCRKCLFRWHRIPPYKPLDEKEIAYITELIFRWIKKELLR